MLLLLSVNDRLNKINNDYRNTMTNECIGDQKGITNVYLNNCTLESLNLCMVAQFFLILWLSLIFNIYVQFIFEL